MCEPISESHVACETSEPSCRSPCAHRNRRAGLQGELISKAAGP